MENGPLNISDSEAARNVTPLARHSDISIQLTLVLAFTVLPLGEIKADILVDDNNSSGQQQTVTAPNDYTQTTDLIDNSGFAVDINSTNGANGTLKISSGVTLSAANASTVVVRTGTTLSAFDVQGTLISNSYNALIAHPTSTINTFTNSGTIQAQTTNFAAIYLPGAVTNFTNTGLIEHTAGSTALVIDNVTTLVNDSSGSIIGADAVGVRLGFASPGTIGSFTNNGLISGGTTAIELGFSPGSTAGITNSGTITGVVDGLEVRNGSELTFFDNTGGTIESTGASGAGLHLSEDQDTGITNAGILRSTSTGNGLLLDTEAQTRDFTNSGTISSVSGTAIVSQTAMTGDINGFVNSGTITGGGGTAIDARDAFTLTNSGTITGDISHTTAGVLTIDHTDGAIVGGITSVVDAAHSLSFGGGTVNGNVTLDGITANTFVLDGTAITGNVDLGDGAAHAVSLSRGSISGLLDIGSETTALSINAAAGDSVTIGTLATNDTTTTNINGAGDVNITTFTVNGTANQSAGTLTAGTLSVGTSGTFNQSGTSVLDVATLNLDGAATLNLNGTGARITGAINGSVDSAVIVNGSFSSEDTINVGRMEIANGGVLNVAHDVTTTSPTAFTVNGTANQSAGTLTAAALSVGTNGTFNQSGTSVLDVAALNLDGAATLNLNGTGARVTGAIVGTTDSAVVVNGSFSSEDTINVGRLEVADGGLFNMAHDVTTTSAATVNGTANQSAGTLTAAALSVGTNGTFNQSGTSVLDVATLNLDGAATLNLNGTGARVTGAIVGTTDSAVIVNGSFSSEDTINVGRMEIANGGLFNMAHDVTTTSAATVNGTANQSAGTLTAAALSVGTNGTFNQSGTSVLDVATLNLDGAATLNLNGTGARVTGAITGATDSAVVVNGSFSSEDAINVGRMEIANGAVFNVAHDVTTVSPTAFAVNGTANQSAGTLTAGTLAVGINGTFNQSGTSVLDVATLNLDGTLNLNGNGARVTGAITGTADSAIIISGSFSSEDAINVGRLEIAGGGTFNAAHDITTTSSSAFSNLGTLVIDAGDTVTIAGDYSQGADGIFQTNVTNDTSFGRLVVLGTANLPSNARIDVNVADTDFNFSVNELQDIITAGTLVSDGTFSVSDNSNLFDFHAILSGNTVDLCLAAAGGSCGSRSSIGVYEAVVANRNWPGIGAAIVFDDLIDSFVADATTGNDGMDNVIASLGAFGTQKEVSDAVTQTLPLLAAGSSIPIRNVLSSTRRIVQFGLRDNSRLSWEEDRDLSNGNIWANVYRTHHNQNDRSGATGFYGISEGLVLGVDGNTDAHSNLGIAFAYGSTDVDNNTDLHSADIKTYQLIGYGRHSVSESAEVSIQIGLSKSKTEGRRTIAFADDAPTALSDYDTTGIHLGIGIGRVLKLGSATQFIPTMHMDYTRLTSDGYTETGAETLNINARSTHLEAFELGLNGQLRHRINAKASLVASFGIAYDTLNEQPTVTGRFAGGGDAFVTRGIHPSPWIGGASINFPITLGNNKYITIGYDVEARRSYDNHTASMEFRWRF